MMRVYATGSHEAPPSISGGSATYTRVGALRPAGHARFTSQAVLRSTVEPDTTHRVERGENLTRIVRQYLEHIGSEPTPVEVYRGVRIVAEHNGIANPDLIHPEQLIDLSSLRAATTPPPASAALSGGSPRQPVLPEPVQSPPAPRASVRDANRLADPATSAASPAPQDALRQDVAVTGTGPVRISASAVAALMTPPYQTETPGSVPVRRSGPSGGPGPVPSEAARAIQRILNRSANALSALRGLMDGPPTAIDDGGVPTPWSGLLQGAARISSEFGMRKDPFSGRMQFHDGVDLAVKRGTGITALREGEVVFSGWKGGYGNTVIIRHDNGVETVYGHAARLHVRPGDSVAAGAVIADAGSSGRSTGPHLHFEVREHGRAVNPMPYLEGPGQPVAVVGAP